MEPAAGAAQAPPGYCWNLVNAYVFNQLTNLCHRHGLRVDPTGDVLAFILRILAAVMTKYNLTPETRENDSHMLVREIIDDDPLLAIEDLVKYFQEVVSDDVIGNKELPAEWLYNSLCQLLNDADRNRKVLDWRDMDNIWQIKVEGSTLRDNFTFRHIYDLLSAQQRLIIDRDCLKDLMAFFQPISPDVSLQTMLTITQKSFFAIMPKLKQLIENYVNFLLIRLHSKDMNVLPRETIINNCIAQRQLDVIEEMFKNTAFSKSLKHGVLQRFGLFGLVPAFILYLQRHATESQLHHPTGYHSDMIQYASQFWHLRYKDHLERDPWTNQSTRPEMKSDWKADDSTMIFWENHFFFCHVTGAGSPPGYFETIDFNQKLLDVHPTQMYTLVELTNLQQEIWNWKFSCGDYVRSKDDKIQGQVVSAFNGNILTVRSQDGKRFEKHKDMLEPIKNAIRMDDVEGSFQLHNTVDFTSNNGDELVGFISSMFHDKDAKLLAFEVCADKKYYVRLGSELAKSRKKLPKPSAKAKWGDLKAQNPGRRSGRASAAGSAQEASSEAASVTSSPAPSVASVQAASSAGAPRSATTVRFKVGDAVLAKHNGQQVRGTIREIWYKVELFDEDGRQETLLRQDEVHKV
jgi:hypothetical protein